jgi:CHAT domain-containing protein
MARTYVDGANRAHGEHEDDGILTALEVAGLDLHGVDLAVLSACQTGLGENAGGEGLLGLQRAFQVSGARGVVASLWKVDDSATQALMVELYRNLWERKLGKQEALRQAQLAMLERYDPKAGQLRGAGAKDMIRPSFRSGHILKQPCAVDRWDNCGSHWGILLLGRIRDYATVFG